MSERTPSIAGRDKAWIRIEDGVISVQHKTGVEMYWEESNPDVVGINEFLGSGSWRGLPDWAKQPVCIDAEYLEEMMSLRKSYLEAK